MKSECHFYLDRAAKCLDMAEHVDRQYRGDLIQIARGWMRLAQEEFVEGLAVPEQTSAAASPQDSVY
jgi:hypothetical protein